MNDVGLDGVATKAGTSLRSICTPELDPVFWPMSRLDVESAWVSHVPFAHWLVATHRPRVLVELGTHTGVSYSAFCEAVQRSMINCACLAFDTWAGDDHSGQYGEEVYANFTRFHDARYGAFSHLTRCTFDDGAAYVADASIDLLHIDGLHTYEAVEHDFRTWQPKLSQQAIVLFHDINERARNFGAWRLWDDLRAMYPSFTFLHGHGLGVLAVGPSQCETIRTLTALPGDLVQAVRNRFSFLGERWEALAEQDRLRRRIEHLDQVRLAENSDKDGLLRHIEHLDRLRAAEALERDELARQAGHAEALKAEEVACSAASEAKIATLVQELAAARAGNAAAAADTAVLRERLDVAERAEEAAQARSLHLQTLLHEMLHAAAAGNGAAA